MPEEVGSQIEHSPRKIENLSEQADPVTGYPVETAESRGKIINIFEEAIRDKKTVLFIDADIDFLKQLNDQFGKKKANQAIKQTVEEKESILFSIQGAKVAVVYRPQAGGDEFKAVLVVDQELSLEELHEKLIKPTLFSDQEITTSFGLVIEKPNGDEKANQLFQEMEQEAERKLVIKKLKVIDDAIEETIQEGRFLSIEEYKIRLVERWGAKRITANVLNIILNHVDAKRVKLTLSTGKHFNR